MDTLEIDEIVNAGISYFNIEEKVFVQTLHADPIMICKIVKRKGKWILLKKEKESDKLRKWNAWSIPYKLIKYFDIAYVKTEADVYKITREKAVTMGIFRNLNDEPKLIINLKYWDRKSEL